MLIKAVEKVLNISAHEFQRTAYAWAVRLLYRIGYVLGWTTLVAMFVTRFSIQWFPFLFLIQAALTMISMGLFSFLHEHFPIKTLIAFCALGTGLTVFLSTLVIGNVWLFFGLLLIAFGIFTPQLTIFLASYIEDFFTPLEAERIFPVIESAETVGGILGGLLISSFSFFIVSHKFFYIWIFLMAMMVGVVFLLQPSTASYHHFFAKTPKNSLGDRFRQFHKNITQIKVVPFLQGLLLIFLLYWIVVQLLEFQYTKVVNESIGAAAGSEDHQTGLAHGLGSLQMLFHASALMVQLLVASRILKKLGTAGGFLLHALVTFFGALSLLFGFSYFTVILARNNFELTGIINKNAYEGSYYALRHGTQRALREFFEAFIYPLGTIIGTALLLGLNFFFLEKHVFPILQLILIFLTFLMVIFALRMQQSYTSLSKENLLNAEHQLSKLHAIEILSQNGHRHGFETMIAALQKPSESAEVKVKILEAMGKNHDQRALPVILNFFNDVNPLLVLAAVKALKGFNTLDQRVVNHVFSRYRVIQELRKLFITTTDEKIRSNIVQVMAMLHDHEIVNFLLEIMKTASPSLKIACIAACASFHDPMATYYIKPFLKDKKPPVKAQAILALWKLKFKRKSLQNTINAMLQSYRREDVLAVCSIIGDIGDFKRKDRLIPYLTVIDPQLRLHASLSLLKLGYKEAGNYLAHLLFSKNSVVLEKAKELLRELKPDLKNYMRGLIHKKISQGMHLLFANKKNVCENLTAANDTPGQTSHKELLERFKQAYLSIDAYEEADALDAMMCQNSA